MRPLSQMVSMRLLLIKLYGIKYSLNAKRDARNHKFTVKDKPTDWDCKCPKCGAAMVADNTTNTLKDGTKKRIKYYSCSNFKTKVQKFVQPIVLEQMY